jgi:hypothetical protein
VGVVAWLCRAERVGFEEDAHVVAAVEGVLGRQAGGFRGKF